jgi:hypothetical protein
MGEAQQYCWRVRVCNIRKVIAMKEESENESQQGPINYGDVGYWE